jgi:hypothetical protein
MLDLEKEILDITKNVYNSFKPIDGDAYTDKSELSINIKIEYLLVGQFINLVFMQ